MTAINIRYIDHGEGTFPLGQVDKPADEWVDLYTAETVTIHPLTAARVPLGVAMQLPANTEAIVAARSSLFRKHHVMLANNIGIIDNSYAGDNDEWQAELLAFEETTILAGTRIAQFRLLPNQSQLFGDVMFNEVDHLSAPDRGGFGSTGTN